MEKTYKRVPFDIELAKKIQAGEIEGRVRIGKYNDVRIICLDRKGKVDPIVALVTSPRMGKFEFLVTISNEGYVDYLGYESFGISTYEKVKAHIEFTEEAPKHEFKPFDKVLVRNKSTERWHPSLYATTDGLLYYTTDCKNWQQCIPYDGNQELVGTTDKPE